MGGIPKGDVAACDLKHGRQGNEMIFIMVAKTVDTIFPANLRIPMITARMPATIARITFPIRTTILPINPAMRYFSERIYQASQESQRQSQPAEEQPIAPKRPQSGISGMQS